jgi:hypothetical protein
VAEVPELPMPNGAAEETDKLRQWWSRLSDAARDALSADPAAPIPAEHLDEVLSGGIRVIGRQRGGATMEWSLAPRTCAFVRSQVGRVARPSTPCDAEHRDVPVRN